jgi:hypothetical protein
MKKTIKNSGNQWETITRICPNTGKKQEIQVKAESRYIEYQCVKHRRKECGYYMSPICHCLFDKEFRVIHIMHHFTHNPLVKRYAEKWTIYKLDNSRITE